MKRAVGTSITVVLLFASFTSLGADAPKANPPGARGGPRHDDLAAPWTWKLPEGRASVATEGLPADDAKAILAAPVFSEDSASQLRYLDVTAKGAREEEAKRVAEDAAAVKRQGGLLTLAPKSGSAIAFKNKVLPERKDREGDRIDYLYVGRLGKGRLLRVEAWFQHDSPGSYLVNPDDGRSVFVHEGSDHVALSSDGQRLFTFNDLNSPLTLAVVSVAAEGPSLELLCRARLKGNVELKGWHGPGAIDLVLHGESGAQNMPVRVDRAAKGWRVLTPDAVRPISDFVCMEGPF